MTDKPKKVCARCGYDEKQSAIHEHHINSDRDNKNAELVYLCSDCHNGLHHGKWDGSEIGIPNPPKNYQTRVRRNHKLPKDLLTHEDVKKMIKTTFGQNQALIAVMYESGGRYDQIVNCKISDEVFNESGCTLIFREGKTKEQKIQLFFSIDYLRNWIMVHPFREDPEAPLWLSPKSKKDEQKTFTSFNCVLKTAMKHAGIKKEATPSIFQHLRENYYIEMRSETKKCPKCNNLTNGVKLYDGITHCFVCGSDINFDASKELNRHLIELLSKKQNVEEGVEA